MGQFPRSMVLPKTVPVKDQTCGTCGAFPLQFHELPKTMGDESSLPFRGEDTMKGCLALLTMALTWAGSNSFNGREEASGISVITSFTALHDDKEKEADKRRERHNRWQIILPRESPEVFVKKLAELKATIVIPDGMSATSFKICDDLGKKPVTFKQLDKKELSHLDLWFVSKDRRDCEALARGLFLKDSPNSFAVIFPPDLEQELVKAETNHRRLTEEELNKRRWTTTFDVSRKDGKWEIKVRFQGPRKD